MGACSGKGKKESGGQQQQQPEAASAPARSTERIAEGEGGRDGDPRADGVRRPSATDVFQDPEPDRDAAAAVSDKVATPAVPIEYRDDPSLDDNVRRERKELRRAFQSGHAGDPARADWQDDSGAHPLERARLARLREAHSRGTVISARRKRGDRRLSAALLAEAAAATPPLAPSRGSPKGYPPGMAPRMASGKTTGPDPAQGEDSRRPQIRRDSTCSIKSTAPPGATAATAPMGSAGRKLPPSWKGSVASPPSVMKSVSRSREAEPARTGSPPLEPLDTAAAVAAAAPAPESGQRSPSSPPSELLDESVGMPAALSLDADPQRDLTGAPMQRDLTGDGGAAVLQEQRERIAELERRARESEAACAAAEAKAEEAIRRAEAADRLAESGRPTQPPAPRAGARHPGFSSASETDAAAAAPADGPGAVVRELKEGLGVYTVATPLQGFGTGYALRNSSRRAAVVTLDFAGSKNAKFTVADGSKSVLTEEDGRVEIVTELQPHSQHNVCTVVPVDEYAPWTVALSGRWRLLAGDGDAPAPHSGDGLDVLTVEPLTLGSVQPVLSRNRSQREPTPAFRQSTEPLRSSTVSPQIRTPAMPVALPAVVRSPSDQMSPRYPVSPSFAREYTHTVAVRAIPSPRPLSGASASGSIDQSSPGRGPGAWAPAENDQRWMPVTIPYRDREMPCGDATLPGAQSWRRAEEAYGAGLREILKPTDCAVTGPAWVAGALAVMRDAAPNSLEALYPALLSDAEPMPAEGAVEAWWCCLGWWTCVIVDSFLPFAGDGSCPVGVSGTGCAWPALAAKTYAKALGGYNHLLSGGQIGHVLSDATGCPYQKVPLAVDGGDSASLETLWDWITQHYRLGHIVAVSTASPHTLSRAGDCDGEPSPRRRRPGAHRPLPHSSAAAVLDVRAAPDPRYCALLLRVSMPPAPLPVPAPIGRVPPAPAPPEWVTFGEVVSQYDSATVCMLTPGWTDVRLKLSTRLFSADTAVEISVPAAVRVHLWLGAAKRRPADGCTPIGIAVVSPTGPSGGYVVSEELFGVEASSQVWGELVLQRTARPHLIVPLICGVDSGEEYRLCLRISDVREQSAGGPGVPPAAGVTDARLRFVGLSSSLLEQMYLASALLSTQSRPVADGVCLYMQQHFRLLLCAVHNDAASPCVVVVSFAQSEGYSDCTPSSERTSKIADLTYRTHLPPRTSALVCCLVARAPEWAYQVEAQCQWEDECPAGIGGEGLDDLAARAVAAQASARPAQYNGESMTADVLSVPVDCL